jgi:hypothetical protein
MWHSWGGERFLQGFGWEDNITMNLREMGIDGKNWIQLAQNTVQWRGFLSTVVNLRVP